MSIAKIEEVIDAFARAAADAKRLGFDGVELHGAHGYLIDQFFWKETNRLTDEYGGDWWAAPVLPAALSMPYARRSAASSPSSSASPNGKPAITMPSWRTPPWNWKIF